MRGCGTRPGRTVIICRDGLYLDGGWLEDRCGRRYDKIFGTRRARFGSRAVRADAIVTLALGIGASTAIFSVMDNVLMEPFPYVDAQRFMTVLIHDTERNEEGGRGGYTGPEFLDIIEQNHVFDRVIANIRKTCCIGRAKARSFSTALW